jgi:hypothetical protein
MSEAARGKAGSLIFNQWRSLNTVKMFRSPTQPNTPAQLTARTLLTEASQAWAGLTVERRAAWQQYAIDHLETDWTGKPKRLTSQNWYVRCYARATMVGGTAPDDPPVVSAPAAPTGINIVNAGGAGTPLSLAWTTPVAAGLWLVVYRCGPISLGRIPRFEQASILEKVAASSGTPEELIAAAVAGRYGFWVQCVDEATGLCAGLVYDEITVA